MRLTERGRWLRTELLVALSVGLGALLLTVLALVIA